MLGALEEAFVGKKENPQTPSKGCGNGCNDGHRDDGLKEKPPAITAMTVAAGDRPMTKGKMATTKAQTMMVVVMFGNTQWSRDQQEGSTTDNQR